MEEVIVRTWDQLEKMFNLTRETDSPEVVFQYSLSPFIDFLYTTGDFEPILASYFTCEQYIQYREVLCEQPDRIEVVNMMYAKPDVPTITQKALTTAPKVRDYMTLDDLVSLVSTFVARRMPFVATCDVDVQGFSFAIH